MIRHCLQLHFSIQASFHRSFLRCLSSTTETRVPEIELELNSDQTPSITESKVICKRELSHPPKHPHVNLQSWVSTLSRFKDDKVGLVDLHPEVFGSHPRLDVLHENVHWQLMYRNINYSRVKTRAEMSGGGRKPWPQKGTGRARHGSIRSPLWIGGGRAKGPRGPKNQFYMLPVGVRLLGLTTTLSCKLAQNDLFIVDSLETPTNDPAYLKDLQKARDWGLSLLFVDDNDKVPQNFATALSQIPEYNAMPVFGLNVYSMLKHETVILTLAALERIEERIMFHKHKAGRVQTKHKLLY
ncbi:large ribosomal subunit protein uL4m-like [Watersipora subatra]|uniref:large ribosomal subunit protein uL4m-like n=1 Tax=Watersipora subatra TaxID=2589382 RepID=UPI00355C1715